MKAFILDRYGKQQTLRLGEVPAPVPGPDEVLVRIGAASLNPFEQLNDAFAYLETGRAKGKVVVTLGDASAA